MFRSLAKPLFVAFMAIVAANQEGCIPPGGEELNKAYNKELVECVNKSRSTKESCECRKEVDERWGICKWTDAPWPAISRCSVTCQ